MSKEFPTINKESPSINRGATIIYRGHSDNVFTVAWSPDGKYIASGSRDKTVRVWDVATGEDYFIYRGHNKCVLSAAWSPGHGAYIASGDTGGIVQVWEAFTGSSIVSYRDTSPRVEITVIVRRRCGRPLPESKSIPMISSTGYFLLPGRQVPR